MFPQEGTNPERREFTVSVVFVMSKETAPPEGELIGDILYVPVAEGYHNIVFKTKAMLCLVRVDVVGGRVLVVVLGGGLMGAAVLLSVVVIVFCVFVAAGVGSGRFVIISVVFFSNITLYIYRSSRPTGLGHAVFGVCLPPHPIPSPTTL